MIAELTETEREDIEAEAKKVVALRYGGETVEVTDFKWNDEAGHYQLTTTYEKEGRSHRAWGHVETRESNGRRTHSFLVDGGSGPGF